MKKVNVMSGAISSWESWAASHPGEAAIPRYTDKYFVRTRAIVERFGDCHVTYALFMRRPVVSAMRLAIEWLEAICRIRKVVVAIESCCAEGEWIGANDVMLRVRGPFAALVEMETLLLQKLGAACVAASNVFTMASALPRVAFVAMDARHCAGIEMAEMMAYAAAVGSAAARRRCGAVGFIANATDATAHYFGQPAGHGTMPHALIGYAGSTVRAAEMFHETFPNEDLTVLIDYFGREITDSLAVARRFADMAATGRLSVRLDTHGGRFIEGLDPEHSRALLERRVPEALRHTMTEEEHSFLTGPGVSAAAVWHLRESLNEAGFPKVRLMVSSGFSPKKCAIMACAEAPIDVIGTGSYLPENWSETYATADIVAYEDIPRVKMGRDFLLGTGGNTEKRS
ncbi:MAG: hypothetical protein FD149_1796 [Rhodospirillaceae bacterium]|nr:MAG: hypothetical protein FD149_1796 [Rhodospirillaceae bacterium]